MEKNLISFSSQEKAIVIINEIEKFLEREKLEKFEINKLPLYIQKNLIFCQIYKLS